jgi:hypothetical protein
VPAGPRPWSRPCSTALLPGRPAPGHCRAWPLGVAQVRPVEQGLATAWGQGLATAEQHLAQDQAARPDTPLPLTKCLVAAPATSRCYGCGAGACGRMTSPRMLRTSAEPMIRGSRAKVGRAESATLALRVRLVWIPIQFMSASSLSHSRSARSRSTPAMGPRMRRHGTVCQVTPPPGESRSPRTGRARTHQESFILLTI